MINALLNWNPLAVVEVEVEVVDLRRTYGGSRVDDDDYHTPRNAGRLMLADGTLLLVI